jgi:CPA1 family monovalent cation:H+ antiporter
MQAAGIHHVQLMLLLLLVFAIGFGTLAQRLKTPYPIIQVIGGLLLSFIPELPRFSLDPNLFFFAILPPLLFSGAWNTSWRDFRYNLVSIFSLAFGLVGFTVVGVSITAQWLLPGFDWRLGLVLGAVVSTTDPIAATAIAKRVGLPERIIDILEGESLVNDASGLLALEFSTNLVLTGNTPSLAEGAGRLLFLVAGGIVTGLVIGEIIYLFEKWVDNAPIEITISIVTPYLAYLGAEAIKASGVLATVACGLYLGRRSSSFFSSSSRIQASATWRTLTFILNSIVFVLIGLQLPAILQGIEWLSHREFAFSATVVVSVIILLRLIWVYPGAYVGYLVRRYLMKQDEQLPCARSIFVIGWTGMRGVLSLAAAISLPIAVSNGRPFPGRNLIIFLTFCVIFVTLVVQGLTLPAVIRKLGLAGAAAENPEEQEARRKTVRAALDRLGELRAKDQQEYDSVYEDIALHYRRRLAALEGNDDNAEATPQHEERYRSLTQQLHDVERSAAIGLRDKGEISDSVLRTLERELDLLEARYPRK